MAYYAKASLSASLALDANFTSKIWDVNPATTPAYAVTTVKEQNIRRTVGFAGAENLDLSGLTTGATTDNSKVRMVAVINLDPSNYVTLNYGTAGTATLSAHKILPGGFHVLTDLNLTNAPTIQASNAACDVQIIALIAAS